MRRNFAEPGDAGVAKEGAGVEATSDGAGDELPGPLDGHRRPAEIGANRLSENDIEKAKEDLANNPDASVLAPLAYLSQRFDLGEELLAQMREAITRSAFVSEGTSLDERIERSMAVGFIAGAQRDVELASTIASTVIAMAHLARLDSDVVRILQALLIASTAFQNEDEWAEWLERQLVDVALYLPAGEPSKTFLAHLQELKKVLKLNLGIHVRAEALASAAN